MEGEKDCLFVEKGVKQGRRERGREKKFEKEKKEKNLQGMDNSRDGLVPENEDACAWHLTIAA